MSQAMRKMTARMSEVVAESLERAKAQREMPLDRMVKTVAMIPPIRMRRLQIESVSQMDLRMWPSKMDAQLTMASRQ